MKKRNKLQTIASYILGLTMAASPVAKAIVPQSSQIEVTTQKDNKATVPTQNRKGQGIDINEMTGGLNFNHDVMMKFTSPIFDPKRPHGKSYPSQKRDKMNRKNKK